MCPSRDKQISKMCYIHCYCCCCKVTSVVSDSVWSHRRQPTRLLCPWDSPGKNTGVGCHFLLPCVKVKNESEVIQSCLTLSDPTDHSLPGSPIYGTFQARVLEWGAIAFSNIHCYSVTKLCPTLPPHELQMPGLSVQHYFPEFSQAHLHWVIDTTQPSHPLLPPSPLALNFFHHQGLF